MFLQQVRVPLLIWWFTCLRAKVELSVPEVTASQESILTVQVKHICSSITGFLKNIKMASDDSSKVHKVYAQLTWLDLDTHKE